MQPPYRAQAPSTALIGPVGGGAGRLYNIGMRTADRDGLRERWERLCRGLATPAHCEQTFQRLWSAYTAADRHYHDILHVADCLRHLDSVRHLAPHPGAIEWAIWFHDLVYDGTRTDNEERSADQARATLSRLQAEPGLIEQVVELILLTRHDREPKTRDGELMVDIDLASLALPAEQFDENSRRIRREFSHVAEADFVRGRAAMLGRFLERSSIYYTDLFRDRCERAARANLERVVSGA